MSAPTSFASLSRRRFLQASSAALVGASLPPAAWSQNQGTDKLIVREEQPYNAEPPLDKLVEAWSTPTERFFVRSHGTMPELDAKSYRLKIEGRVKKPLELSLDDLASIGRKVRNHVTITCAGNRRDEMSAIKKISGVQWNAGAIGNPEWEGINLRDVLAEAGVEADSLHVWFEGLDEVQHAGETIAFGGSIPLQKLAAKELPTLLATHMNGEPLTREHGAPLRVVVPGYIGARSVKWLGKIVVSDRPSPNHFLAETYKIVKTSDPQEMAAADPIYENVLNAAICVPAAGAQLTAGETTLAGYALPRGKPTRTIARVEVSVDDGEWQAARLGPSDQPFCWALWKHTVKLSPGKHRLRVRTTDSSDEQQPETVAWNAKGYLYNAWHAVEVEVA